MAGKLKPGSLVSWSWGKGTGTGKVLASSQKKTVKKIKGSKVTRKGSKSDPALLIQQKNGNRVLKLAHEVNKAG